MNLNMNKYIDSEKLKTEIERRKKFMMMQLLNSVITEQ